MAWHHTAGKASTPKVSTPRVPVPKPTTTPAPTGAHQRATGAHQHTAGVHQRTTGAHQQPTGAHQHGVGTHHSGHHGTQQPTLPPKQQKTGHYAEKHHPHFGHASQTIGKGVKGIH